MAFSVVTVSDQDDFITKLETFLSANGWTTELTKTADGTGFRLHMSITGTSTAFGGTSTDLHFAFRSSFGENIFGITQTGPGGTDTNGASIVGSDGFSGIGDAWDAQTPNPSFLAGTEAGASRMHQSFLTPGQRVLFFHNLNPTQVVVVDEFEPGKYNWMMFGEVRKVSTFTGGQVMGASWSGESNRVWLGSSQREFFNFYRRTATGRNSALRIDDAIRVQKWLAPEVAGAQSTLRGMSFIGGRGSYLQGRTPNTFDGTPILFPFHIYQTIASSLRQPTGYVDHFRSVNIRDLDPETILTLGAEDWQVFPWREKSPVAVADNNTGTGLESGFAVKRTP
jgi:hypothetical protein